MPRESDAAAAGLSLTLAEASALCGRDTRFLAELERLLGDVDAAIAAEGPTCRACGQCCHFEQFGHRLFVSSGELALLTRHVPPQPHRPGRCPYQLAERCEARAGRGLGCRVFFCDAALGPWCEQVYETFHGQIRRLHDTAGLPYRYGELTAALAEAFPAGR